MGCTISAKMALLTTPHHVMRQPIKKKVRAYSQAASPLGSMYRMKNVKGSPDQPSAVSLMLVTSDMYGCI